MLNMIKSLFLILLGFAIFLGNSVFADAIPSFKTLETEVLENGIVRLRGEFNSNGANYLYSDQPETWFEFGDDINDLEFTTPRRSRVRGEYVVSQGATRFQKDTQYYVRAVMRYDGDTERGDIIAFDPYKTTPVILPTETTIPVNSAPLPANGSVITTPTNTNSSTTSSGLQPPLDYSFNLLDFSQFRLPSGKDSQNTEDAVTTEDTQELITEKEKDKKPTTQSNFENSASNTDGSDEYIREKGSNRNSGSISSNRNSQSASVANSGVRTSFPAYLAFLLVVIMIAISVVLFRLTHEKKQRLRYTQVPTENQGYGTYNPNQGAYSQYSSQNKPK